MNKLQISDPIKIRQGKLEGAKKIRDKAKIHADEKFVDIVKGDLP